MCLSWLMGKFIFPRSWLRHSRGKILSLFLNIKGICHFLVVSENLLIKLPWRKFWTFGHYAGGTSFCPSGVVTTLGENYFPRGWSRYQPLGKLFSQRLVQMPTSGKIIFPEVGPYTNHGENNFPWWWYKIVYLLVYTWMKFSLSTRKCNTLGVDK